jgi:hypothetical protein
MYILLNILKINSKHLKIKSKWGKKGKLRREKYSGVIDVTIIRYKQIEKKYSKHKHKHSNEQNIIKC